ARADMDRLPDRFFESGGLHREVVVAGLEKRESVESGRVRDALDLRACGGFGRGNFGADNSGAGWIGDRAAHGTAEFLGSGRHHDKHGGKCETAEMAHGFLPETTAAFLLDGLYSRPKRQSNRFTETVRSAKLKKLHTLGMS